MPSGTETILLAEDEAGVRRFVRKTLEQHGYRVLECSNGPEAIERARQNPASIQLLLTDAVMPEMGIAELVAQFAACRPGVPVLRMSGYSDLVWPGVDAEASYLQKPFTPAALLARVRALLDRIACLAPFDGCLQCRQGPGTDGRAVCSASLRLEAICFIWFWPWCDFL
jgi:two-component system cell cycle sensor histidine kinase/response regulator CckA